MTKPYLNPLAMTESVFLSHIIQLARITGWKVAHFRAAMTKHGWRTPVQADGKGFPDCIFIHCKTNRLIVAELKSEKGKVTPEQQGWLDDFARIAAVVPEVKVYLWKPSDWEEIVRIFNGKRSDEAANPD